MRASRRPQINVPAGYKLPKIGPSTQGRIGGEDYMNRQKIVLKDLQGNVIARGVTRREALQIIRNRYESGVV